mgnify:CR=1 FL=1
MPNYDIIAETDPYYWSIKEFDMLSISNHAITNRNPIANTMPSSANGCTPPSSVLCAQRPLNSDSLDFRSPHVQTEVEGESFATKNDMKPVYRKTPVPNRKFTSFSESATVSSSHPPTQQMDSGVPCESKLSFIGGQLRVCDRDDLSMDSLITATNCLAPADLMDKNEDDTPSEPVYCNIDMEDALSVHDVYTI